jgi:hypothetical protein
MFVNVFRWRVLKENSKKQFELWREIMDYQRYHPEKFLYVKSRFFTSSEKGSSEENWMFSDEYENSKDFDKGMKLMKEDPELVKFSKEYFLKWNDLIIYGSRKQEVWTEAEKLRVESKRKA